ncbi:tetratricopeptide repeat protein [Hymenobacter sp. BT770]|uniref:tetratricopeptide repeat protein n=1 Tax=Hymenobacter sp. BT770 TaxID=2886942 RepID=UPI001D0F6DD6|nr:tetratricopeptide repeat protein [Hymenobacter sp. BT770]MCC3154863.1 tetratricopeptide repeat protein [Hymenobacter sp. BT770]MDO3415613.1 tetratricopeptide repeat protein [Hymenobacter sp. BT770]
MRKYLYPTLLLVFGVLVLAIFVFKKPDARMPALKERHGDLAAGGEWLNTKEAVRGLLAKLRRNPDDYKSRLLLAQAYMQEGRVTGDHAYYDAAAMKLLDAVLRAEPENFEAMACKATLSLTQHHFSQGLALAQQAQQLNPNSGFVYGLLTDAHVELGQYDEAIKMADKMNQVRPDLSAYARVSYLREIYGDVPGAIEAMTMAVKAGLSGMEQTEWTRVALGHLYEISGDLARAEGCYETSLLVRPGYAYALAGRGRVAAARQNYPAAIKDLQQARAMVKDYAFSDELVDLYRQSGQSGKADAMARESIEMLANAAKQADEDEELGHYADRELAYAYLKTNELDKALEHAKIEYARRPDNIDVNETLAWVYFKRGQYAEAQKYMQVARRTHSQNPVLLGRAGLILTKLGKVAEGQALLEKSLRTAPYLNPELAAEGKALIAAR